MSRRALTLLLSAVPLLLFLWPVAPAHAQEGPAARRVPAPEEVLGFSPGDDRRLASWAQVVDYFRRLDTASDRLKFEELGKTTMGAPFVMATISSPENLRRINEFKEIQRHLADPRTLGAGADEKARRLMRAGKTIVLITCGVHSTEVGSYLSSMLIAHRLASSDDPTVREILRDTIILLVPSLNPDGVDIVKRWYDKTLGTPYEGTDPPELYHKYTGHDNNRDWYAFTQVETQLTVDKIHNVWHPQIVHDIHQMGGTGARLFLPPYMEPVEPNVPRQIVEGYTELGGAVAKEMREAGFKGITWDSIYDAWSPSRAYSHYHGGVRILSETASCKIATPITVKFGELKEGKNYDPRKASPNFPEVWPGGEWRLRDITSYMTTAAFSLLKHAAQNRERWLARFYETGKEAVRPRKAGELFAYIIPGDTDAISILKRAGVTVDYVGQFTLNGATYPSGTAVVRMAQPYGAFAKALLERQDYPNHRDAAGNPVAPYDVTAHTLPLLMGFKAVPVYSRFNFPMPKRLYMRAGGCANRPSMELAVYKSSVPSMDEGWTRWVLENQWRLSPPNYGICAPHTISLADEDIRKGGLRARADVIVIPDQAPKVILEGHKPGAMPEEYTGGLGKEGVKSLDEFVRQGGTLILLNRASDFAIEQFKLPLRDVTEGLKRTEFYVPGSILRILVDNTHPIARDMPESAVAWVEESPAFEISGKGPMHDQVRVIAQYAPKSDPLLSGWLLGGERIKGKAALVEVRWGRGRMYLFGFRPQYRAQSLATYPLFFNAILQGAAK